MPETDVERQLPNQGATWWCKLLAKGAGVVAAIVCFICGVIELTSLLHPVCLGAGIIMLLISFTLIMFEAPVCCAYWEATKSITAWINERRYWQKGILYLGMSIIPVAMCPGITSILGCICPFAVGVIYGLMSLGQKADRDEMLLNARNIPMQSL